MVWARGGNPPTHQHESEEAARHEAERLALSAPGTSFCVLELIGACRKSDIQWEDADSQEIPF